VLVIVECSSHECSRGKGVGVLRDNVVEEHCEVLGAVSVGG
jgi:hypothetical protein